MNPKNRVRLGVERLEDRDQPGAVNIVNPWARVNVQWFRRNPWAIVNVATRNAILRTIGRHGIVATPWGTWRW